MLPVGLLLFYGVLRMRADGIRRYHALINRFSMVAYFLHVPLINLTARLLGWPPRHLSLEQGLLVALLITLQVVLLTAGLHRYLERRRADRPPTLQVVE
jgi:hypothetical protein